MTDTQIAFFATFAGVAATLLLASVLALTFLDPDRESDRRVAGSALYVFALGALANTVTLNLALAALASGEPSDLQATRVAATIGISGAFAGLSLVAYSAFVRVAGDEVRLQLAVASIILVIALVVTILLNALL